MRRKLAWAVLGACTLALVGGLFVAFPYFAGRGDWGQVITVDAAVGGIVFFCAALVWAMWEVLP